ncbi:hypothetical protein BaRGS_00039886 [Batillaria attramentaria]|uniref:Endonuclease/exonuclease/phosphatase domain-containing protein n=1 Tax=Batillaria attramentaria TaxID=370345 RepID=A0ABD0J2D1_9CAEN
MLDIVQKYGDVLFLLCGDFNARTAAESPLTIDITSFSSNDVLTDRDDVAYRQSQDFTVNDYGSCLLQLCSQFDLFILNGACNGDMDGNYTFISQQGCSVIDYFIISSAVSFLCCHMSVDEKINSAHMPITCRLLCTADIPVTGKCEPVFVRRMRWSSDLVNVFHDSMQSEEVGQQLQAARNLIPFDINTAVDTFISCLKGAAALYGETCLY